jgi:hypothetical protein
MRDGQSKRTHDISPDLVLTFAISFSRRDCFPPGFAREPNFNAISFQGVRPWSRWIVNRYPAQVKPQSKPNYTFKKPVALALDLVIVRKVVCAAEIAIQQVFIWD